MDRVVNGLLQVWKWQLEEIRQVNFAMAEAIAAAFPSPQLLYQVRLPQEHRVLCADGQHT